MRKMLMVLVASIATLALASSASAATSPITYSGQGVDANGKPTTQICTPGDAGGTIGDVTGNYLLWNLAASKLDNGPVTLHLPDGPVQMEFNGTWKYVSRVYPLSQLLTVTVDFTGTNPTNLVISHGCTRVKLDGKIATTILDESGTAVPGTPPASALGSKVKDSVTFTPAPGGSASDMTTGATVTYHFYTGACGDNSAEVGTGQTVPAGDNSSLTAARAAGSYHYTASYNGNDAYNAIAATNCEPLTINQAQLKIATQIHGVILGFPHSDVGGATHVALGSTVHDTATITGQVAGFTAPGANDVAFTRDGFAVLSDNGNVDAIRSVESAPLAAGSYTYKASVAGNDNYLAATSGDEPLTVDKAQLEISTQIHGVNGAHSDVGGATHVPLGSTVHDTATITGQVAGFTAPGANDVAFTRDGNAVLSDNGNVDAIRSVESAPLAAGSYTYKASVAGNDNYLAATSGDEPLTVDKAQLETSTQIHGVNGAHSDVGGATHVPLGSTVHDTATITGQVAGFTAPGANDVAFTRDGNAVLSDNGNVDAIRSVESAPLAAGSYTYKASVAGNDNYLAATSGDEPLTVDKAQLETSTQIHGVNGAHSDVGGATHVPLGSTVHDTATITGQVAGFTAPGANDVAFTRDGNAVLSDNGNVDAIRSVESAPLAAGSYTYKASVAGNDNYLAATSGDEPLTVDKAQLETSTQIHGVNGAHSDVGGATHVPLGSTVHDTATITGQVAGFTAPGANDVAFTRDGNAVLSDNGNVDAIRSVESAPLAAGSYTYKASVAGNDNYLAATSGDEPLTVDKAQLEISTQIHGVNGAHSDVGGATHVPLGSTVHDTATITGQVAGFTAPGANDVAFTRDGNAVLSDNGNVDAIRSVESA